jgi:hypothetical protein
VHDTTCLLRTAPHAVSRCSCPHPSTLHPRRALPFSPAAASAKTALVRRASDPSGAEPQREHKQPAASSRRQFARAFTARQVPDRCPVHAVHAPDTATAGLATEERPRVQSTPSSTSIGRPSTPASLAYCTHNRQQPALALALAAAAAAQPQPSQCATPSALGPPARSPLKVYERLRPRQRCLSLRTVFASHHRLSRSPPRSRARPSPRRACSVHGHYTPG